MSTIKDDRLREAIRLSQNGKKSEARGILINILRSNPRNDAGWLWLADTASGMDERLLVLRQGAKMNPGSLLLKRAIAALQTSSSLHKGQFEDHEKVTPAPDVVPPAGKPPIQENSDLPLRPQAFEVNTVRKEEQAARLSDVIKNDSPLLTVEETPVDFSADETPVLRLEESRIHFAENETPILKAREDEVQFAEDETPLLTLEKEGEPEYPEEESPILSVEEESKLFSIDEEIPISMSPEEERRQAHLERLARQEEQSEEQPVKLSARKRSPWFWLVIPLLVTAILATIVAAVYMWTSEQKRLNETLQTLQPAVIPSITLMSSPTSNATSSVLASSTPTTTIETPSATPEEFFTPAVISPLNVQDIKTVARYQTQGALLALSPDWSLAAVSGGSRVGIWDIQNNVFRGDYANQAGEILEAAISPHNRYLYTASSDYIIQKWDLSSGEMILIFPSDALAFEDFLSASQTEEFLPGVSIRLSGDGTRLAAGLYGLFMLYNAEDGSLLRQLLPEIPQVENDFSTISDVFHADFSPDGNLLAVGYPGTTYILDAGSGNNIQTLITDFVSKPGFSPDSLKLIEAFDGNLLLVDPLSRGRLHTFEGLSTEVRRASPFAFSPDGSLLAYETFGIIDTVAVSLWDLENEQEHVLLPGFIQPVSAISFSPDGELVAVVGSEGFSVIFDVESGHELIRLQGYSALFFSPDGTRLLAVGENMLTFMGVDTGMSTVDVDRPEPTAELEEEGIPGLSVEDALAFYQDELAYECNDAVQSSTAGILLWQCGGYNDVFNLPLEIYGSESRAVLWIVADVQSAKYNFEPLNDDEEEDAISALKDAAGVPYDNASPEEAMQWAEQNTAALEGLFDSRQTRFGDVDFTVSLPEPSFTGVLIIGQPR